MISLSFLAGVVELFISSLPAALAGPFDTAQQVGSSLPNPGNSYGQIVRTAVVNLRPLVFMGGIFVITLAGFRMVTTEEEESFTKAKRTISATIAGIMLAFLVEPFIDAFYGDGSVFGSIGVGSVPQSFEGARVGATFLSGEVLGIVNWVLTIVGVLAVLMIIVSGLKAVASSGSEEGLSQLRRTVFSVVAGLLLTGARVAINATFGLPVVSGLPTEGGPGAAITAIINILNFILSFMGIVALAMLVYAGMQMILNFGNEDIYGKAKGLAIRVGIGFVVIAVSLVVINIVISAG